MVYVPTDWEDGPSTDTPITAAQLDRMEAGIVEGTQAASEIQAGNVELATAAEMTTGTDLVRAASPKRIKDYVAATIATAIGSLPSATAATESTQGVVELASAAEMTAGTDLTRPASVKRIADYVVASLSTLSAAVTSQLAGKADISGSIKQFADISTDSVSDGQIYSYESDTGQFLPIDIDSVAATVGADGRLSVADRPKYYRNIIVINEGDQPPADASVNDIVLARPVAVSSTPTMLGSNNNNGTDFTTASGLVVTTSAAANVGDYIVIAYMQSAESGLVSMAAPTLSAGAVSGGFSIPAASEQAISTTVQVGYYVGKVTTLVPAGSTITLKPGANRAWGAFAAFKVPNLVSASVVDRVATGSGNSVTAPANVATAASSTTTQASEVAFGVVAFNSGTPQTRTSIPQSGQGWTDGRSFIFATAFGGGTRGFEVIWKTLSAAAAVTAPFTISDTAGAPATGQWAASLITLKGA